MKHLVFLLLSILCLNTVFGQTTLPAFISDSLDIYVNRAMAKEQLPGLALCIVKDGRVVFMRGYGVKEHGKTGGVDENTLFMIGSNTKAFTSLAMAILQEEGMLTLNDQITKWLPEFKLENKLAGEQAIIRDVLSHRIGFRTFQGDFTYWKSNLTRSQVVEKMQFIKPAYPFRTIYGYCNAGFVVAGEIIPHASGKSWEDFLKERIFTPLNMNRTLALTKDMPGSENIAAAHDFMDYKITKVPYGLLDNLGPAGSICSSVSDMSKWVIMLLEKGMIDGRPVIPEKAIDQIWYPHAIVGVNGHPFNEQHFRLYGLGFNLNDYNGLRKISHTGAVTGFLSNVILMPEKRLGVVILTNSLQNSIYYSLGEEIIDAMLGLPYRNYAGIYEHYDAADRANKLKLEKQYRDSISMKLKTALPIDSYKGTYSNELYGKMQIVVENGELRMRFEHHPKLFAILEPISGNRFYASFNDTDFGREICTFTIENEAVKSAIVKVADFLEYTTYIFMKN